MRVVVLGAGFGGLEVTTAVAEELGHAADITLIDQTESFVFGFSKLDVMFGHADAGGVHHRYADIAKPGVRFVQSSVRAIDPVARSVQTDAGTFEADVLVVALGADLDPAATPGLVEAGHEFYTEAGAFGLRETLTSFKGGNVIVGVTSAPFKCPPAPSECALLTHELLTRLGVRDQSTLSLVMPFGVPVPPSPEASQALLASFAECGIEWVPGALVVALDAEGHVAELSNGRELPFDLFLGVPKHKAPDVVVEAGMTVEGWIPVDPRTLQTQFAGVYAVGDVASVGTPKAGVFAEGQAAVVAAEIIAQHRGRDPEHFYDGRGICYLEFGDGRVAEVDVTFMAGESPHGTLQGPSVGLQANKSEFGTSRVRRWFGKEWSVR
ncbi:MAG: NAD(P)/FAD-dependent oxidoreductase [Actinomycetes bacterium]